MYISSPYKDQKMLTWQYPEGLSPHLVYKMMWDDKISVVWQCPAHSTWQGELPYDEEDERTFATNFCQSFLSHPTVIFQAQGNQNIPSLTLTIRNIKYILQL